MTETAAVEVRDLVVRFGAFTAVDHISFGVREGEIFGFLGANGAGKTTTIRVLCGLLLPTEGEAWLRGIDVRKDPIAVKRAVGYMSQRFTLYDDMTVEANLSFAASLRKLDPAFYRRRRNEILEFISFSRPTDTPVRELAGGIKQQVSLAAALLHDPSVVFLDEPTAGVTPASRARFWALIRDLSKRGKTVFVTTHYMDEAEQCERIALMRDGKIIALDSPAGLKRATFAGRMVELDPLAPLSYEEIRTLQGDPVFEMVEPYGLRFHAAIADQAEWTRRQPELLKRFRIETIEPSLEDVFIRQVEGRSHA